jgi:hypothetical protein
VQLDGQVPAPATDAPPAGGGERAGAGLELDEGSPAAGTGAVIAAASAAELGAMAAVCSGSRANSRRSGPVSDQRDMAMTVVNRGVPRRAPPELTSW